MKAVLVREGRGLVIGDVADPAPDRSDLLVRVHAVSLNRGEVKRARTARDGFRPGWDFAGVVTQAAADGKGPKAGARVVGLLASGAWAELVAAPATMLAEIPDAVSFEQAACLPVAGLTALFALARGYDLLGRKVLITGASGGVGHLACRLAALSGAHVVGVVRSDAAAASAIEAGAHEAAVIGDDPLRAQKYGPFDLILESVGGASLPASLEMLSATGLCVSFGASDPKPAAIDVAKFYMGGGRILAGFALFSEIAGRRSASAGLQRLLALVADGRLAPAIAVQREWSEIATVSADLLARRYPGKAVLTLPA